MPREAILGLAELFLRISPDREPEVAWEAGSVLHALFIGFIVKWFMDPEQAPSAREFAEGMRLLTEHMTGTGGSKPAGKSR